MSGGAFDYVIVGAGSAGCTLANRLSADPSARVLVLEAGGWDRDIWIHMPLGWGRILTNRRHDWMYFSEPEASVDGRAVECARGKVIGGSSSINAMAYVRGHRSDYDRWAASGLAGWGYADVLPYFKRQEAWEDGESEYRGGDGPLTTRRSRYADPVVDAFIEAAVAAGHPRTADYNGADQHGFGRLQSTIRNGRRCGGATGYLRPALARPNLRVEIHALATRVLFEGARAVGVEYVQAGVTHTAHAEREVLLAGGVINSPQLLMLSGIGDPDELRAQGIDVRVPLTGVGRNYQDHVSAIVSFRRKGSGLFHRNMRLDRLGIALARAQLFGTGFAADLPSGLMGFFKTDSSLPAPDAQILFHAGSLNTGPYLPPFKSGGADGFSARAVLLRPESRGRLRLASRDPATPVKIHSNFLATDKDWRVLRKAIAATRAIGRQAPLAGFVESELLPGPSKHSDADVDAHIRATTITVHHPCGTCKMGVASDPSAVVDDELRVFGTERLRVIDGAAMPDLVGGNINATIVMMAERAADLIRGQVRISTKL
jgi:4-pyridoxate dehydrogenase